MDNSIQSKIVAMAFSMAPEIERDLISQRTKEAHLTINRGAAKQTTTPRPVKSFQNQILMPLLIHPKRYSNHQPPIDDCLPIVHKH